LKQIIFGHARRTFLIKYLILLEVRIRARRAEFQGDGKLVDEPATGVPGLVGLILSRVKVVVASGS